MKRNWINAAINFFAIIILVALVDLFAARFSVSEFAEIFTRSAHLAFITALGLIVAVGSFFWPRGMEPQPAV